VLHPHARRPADGCDGDRNLAGVTAVETKMQEIHETPESDPGQLAFELGVSLAGTNIVSVLDDDDAAIEPARRAISRRLTS
jgi:hypothetical protein